MSLREQLILKDGKARPPALLRKACVHGSSAELVSRFRGDLAFDVDFVVGRQIEEYHCVQCGHTVSAEIVMLLYQNYMLTGDPVLVGRNIKW